MKRERRFPAWVPFLAGTVFGGAIAGWLAGRAHRPDVPPPPSRPPECAGSRSPPRLQRRGAPSPTEEPRARRPAPDPDESPRRVSCLEDPVAEKLVGHPIPWDGTIAPEYREATIRRRLAEALDACPELSPVDFTVSCAEPPCIVWSTPPAPWDRCPAWPYASDQVGFAMEPTADGTNQARFDVLMPPDWPGDPALAGEVARRLKARIRAGAMETPTRPPLGDTGGDTGTP